MNFVNDFSSILCIIKVLFITFCYIERLHFNSCNALPQMQAFLPGDFLLRKTTLRLSLRESRHALGVTERANRRLLKRSIQVQHLVSIPPIYQTRAPQMRCPALFSPYGYLIKDRFRMRLQSPEASA